MPGTIPTLRTSATTNQSNVNAKLMSMGVEFKITLNEPFEKFHGFQFFIPLNFAAYTNWVSAPAQLFTNFGISGGTGAGVRFYTGSFLVIDTTFVYHLALPFNNIEYLGSPALNAAGAPIKGNTSGPELRLSLTFLL